MLISLSQVTQQTLQDSSIRLQVTYKKECIRSTARSISQLLQAVVQDVHLHPDNMAAGPASYGMTDTMGRMHSDAQFAGSSSVPAHVEMMGSYRYG